MISLKRQLGLSLVELLVALVISLFLLAGIVQVYTGNRATFSFTNSLAEIQENGRYALDLMSQDLRLANNWGCITEGAIIEDTLDAFTVPGYNAVFHDFVNEEPIEGTDNDGLNGSDTIRIRGGKGRSANVESPFHTRTTQQLTVNGRSSIGGGDIILVARCGKNDAGLKVAEADIHRVTGATLINSNTQTDLTIAANKSQEYQNDAMVIELQTVTYSVQAGASGEPALFRREFNGADEELVEGVENMQVLYGIDDDGDGWPNQFIEADDVLDFEDVMSIRLTLLMRSVNDFVTDEPQTYTFAGAQITAPDQRIRQEFTTTIALRNKLGEEDD